MSTREVRCGGHGFAHRAVQVRCERVPYRGATRMSCIAACPDCKPGTPDCKVGIGRSELEALTEYARLWNTPLADISVREWHA